MKRRFSTLLLALLLAVFASASAEEILYTGTVSKPMTIRAKKSTSAAKLGSVETGELINIVEYGSEWTKVDQNGVVGYVLTRNVEDLAAAAGYNDEADAQYLGVAERSLTIRAEESKSAQKLQQLEEGETVYITELGKEWLAVVKQGVKGYVLADRVNDLRPAHDGIELPEDYQISTSFTAVYSATADVNLSIRKEKDEDTKLIGTVYENESVDVMELDDQWARVKKGDADGYVLRSHLRYFRRYDPYGPYVPGVVFYPYAAVTTENTEIVNSETGESLRTVPKGAVMAVSAMQEDLSVTLPYDRITGRIRATGKLELEVVHPWNEAQTGDLIAVFSTYYDPEQTTQTQIGRLHNIMQGVERLNDVIVPSGEKFYFNDYCAPYTKSNGYEMGPIVNYVSSQKLGYGGGICQVSSTLYNSLLLIGPDIRIVSRSHHSIPGSYVAMGLDATVSYYGPDLVWSNAAESPMFLFAYADMRTKTVYTFVYGTQPDDGTHYKIWSDTIEKLDPPEPKRIAEPLWPTGYSKMVISPRYGYVVEVYRQLIGADGQPAGDVEKLYTDKYVAVQGELHYGTGSSTLPVPNR